MITNCSITLYNKYIVDKATQKVAYKKTIIKKANWQGQPIVATINAAESAKGVVGMTSSINVYIPFVNEFSNKTYIAPKEWNSLGAADRDKFFTFQELDYMVKGECDIADNATLVNMPNLIKVKDNVISLMSVIANDNGSLRMQHFVVGGK